VSLLEHTWLVSRVTVDATGIGEPIAAFLRRALGSGRVTGLKLSAESKSRLGFELLAAVNGGRLRLYEAEARARATRDDGSLAECRQQLESCRAHYRPN